MNPEVYNTVTFPLDTFYLGKDFVYSLRYFTPDMVEISIQDSLRDFDSKIARIRVSIPKIELAKPIVTNVPRDWREAVKARFAPRWLLKRWPVKFLEIRVQTDAILTNFAMLPKRYNPELIVLVTPEGIQCY